MNDPVAVRVRVALGSGGGSPVHRVIAHPLDRAALHEVRAWLREATSQPGVHIVVDLDGCEQPHQHILVALLAVAARRGGSRGSHLSVHGPPAPMVALLHAVGLGDPFDTVPVMERTGDPDPASNWHQQVMLLSAHGNRVASGRCVCNQPWPCRQPP